jgi:hypothetical protein
MLLDAERLFDRLQALLSYQRSSHQKFATTRRCARRNCRLNTMVAVPGVRCISAQGSRSILRGFQKAGSSFLSLRDAILTGVYSGHIGKLNRAP